MNRDATRDTYSGVMRHDAAPACDLAVINELRVTLNAETGN
jgi:hypothetical protein